MFPCIVIIFFLSVVRRGRGYFISFFTRVKEMGGLGLHAQVLCSGTPGGRREQGGTRYPAQGCSRYVVAVRTPAGRTLKRYTDRSRAVGPLLPALPPGHLRSVSEHCMKATALVTNTTSSISPFPAPRFPFRHEAVLDIQLA